METLTRPEKSKTVRNAETMSEFVSELTNLPDVGISLYNNFYDEPAYISYAGLNVKIKQAVQFFREAGVKKGDRVIFPFETSQNVIISFFALIAMGALPLSVKVPMMKSQLDLYNEFILNLKERFNPAYILRSTVLQDVELPIPELPLFRSEEQTESFDGTAVEFYAAQPEEIAFVQFSSGSTSFPTGVPITHANIIKNLSIISETLETHIGGPADPEHDSATTWLPLYHDMGLIGGFLAAIWNEIDVHLTTPVKFLTYPMEWMELISEKRISVSVVPQFGVDYLLRRLETLDAEDMADWNFENLKMIFNGSEPINAPNLRRINEILAPQGFRDNVLQPCYGMAEVVLFVSGNMKAFPTVTQLDNSVEVVCVGRPHASYDLRIMNEDGSQSPEGEIGEIQLQGGSLATGYFEDTKKFWTEDGFYATGDMGFLKEGELFITGRISDRIKINGQSFFASDFEYAVEKLDYMGQGRAVALQTNEKIVILVALARKMHKERDKHIAEIRSAIYSTLGVTVPAEDILLVPSRAIEKTSSGKLKRLAMKKTLEKGQMELI